MCGAECDDHLLKCDEEVRLVRYYTTETEVRVQP